MVTSRYDIHRCQLAIGQQHCAGFMAGLGDGIVQQGLVFDDLATTGPAIRTDNDLGARVFNARCQCASCKASKNHSVNGSNACASQHGEGCLGNHGHVNQNPVTLLHAQLLQGSRHALHFSVQLCEGVDLLGIGLGRYSNQCGLVSAVLEVTVNGVVTQIGGATHKPPCKRRIAVVANLLWRGLPVNALGFFGPKTVPIINGAAIKICVSGHSVFLGAVKTEFIIMNIQLAST